MLLQVSISFHRYWGCLLKILIVRFRCFIYPASQRHYKKMKSAQNILVFKGSLENVTETQLNNAYKRRDITGMNLIWIPGFPFRTMEIFSVAFFCFRPECIYFRTTSSFTNVNNRHLKVRVAYIWQTFCTEAIYSGSGFLRTLLRSIFLMKLGTTALEKMLLLIAAYSANYIWQVLKLLPGWTSIWRICSEYKGLKVAHKSESWHGTVTCMITAYINNHHFDTFHLHLISSEAGQMLIFQLLQGVWVSMHFFEQVAPSVSINFSELRFLQYI